MTKNLLVLFGLASLPLFVGCTGEPGDTDTVPDDSGTDTDDTGTTDIDAPFTVELPTGIAGSVSIRRDDAEVGTCDIGATTCEYTANEAGEYVVVVESELAIFVAMTVEADENGAFPDVVTWNTGGCGDEGWTAETSYGVCSTWVRGEWTLSPNATFYCNDCGGTGYESEIVTDNSPDMDDDGLPDLKLTIEELGGGTDFVMGGNVGHDVENDWNGIVTVSNDLSTVTLYVDDGAHYFVRQ